MSNTPPDKPNFICGHCTRAMCEDCLSMAAEFEFLHSTRMLGLLDSEDAIKKLRQEVALLKEERDRWREFASMGYPKPMVQWMESEVWKAAVKPPPSEAAKVLRRLSKSTREWMLTNQKGS